MLGQRRRRWTSIKPTFCQRLMPAGRFILHIYICTRAPHVTFLVHRPGVGQLPNHANCLPSTDWCIGGDKGGCSSCTSRYTSEDTEHLSASTTDGLHTAIRIRTILSSLNTLPCRAFVLEIIVPFKS